MRFMCVQFNAAYYRCYCNKSLKVAKNKCYNITGSLGTYKELCGIILQISCIFNKFYRLLSYAILCTVNCICCVCLVYTKC